MTREEAIKTFEEILQLSPTLDETGCSVTEAMKVALSTLQAENEKLRADLEKVKRERDAAKSPEVLEAVDELVEFSRTRMSIGGWLCYVNVFGEWRGPQKED